MDTILILPGVHHMHSWKVMYVDTTKDSHKFERFILLPDLDIAISNFNNVSYQFDQFLFRSRQQLQSIMQI